MSKNDVEKFLLKCKIALLSNFDFVWTEKNKATIPLLGYILQDVIDVIKDLAVEDYAEGPLIDRDGFSGEWWVFGKTIQGKEIYIKLKVKDFNSDGEKQLTTLCISFHISEFKLRYPYK